MKDESIVIGDEITVTIVDIRGDKVRLGITAPVHIPVHRLEIQQAIQHSDEKLANCPSCHSSLVRRSSMRPGYFLCANCGTHAPVQPS
jgi:carbon storage regulator